MSAQETRLETPPPSQQEGILPKSIAGLVGPEGISTVIDIEVADPNRITHEEYLSIGELAYSRAVKLEEMHGLNAGTVAEYREASINLINVTATSPINKETGDLQDPDPVRLLKIADSLAKQAQAPVVEPYKDQSRKVDFYGNTLDRRTALQRISLETLQRASRLMMGEDKHEAWTKRFDAKNPTGVLATAAVEAAIDTDTMEYAIEPKTEGEITEDLEAAGEDAVVEFITVHAEKSGSRGVRFIAETAELALEGITEESHKMIGV